MLSPCNVKIVRSPFLLFPISRSSEARAETSRASHTDGGVQMHRERAATQSRRKPSDNKIHEMS